VLLVNPAAQPRSRQAGAGSWRHQKVL